MGVNRTNTEQFQLRLPPGLRDRIKAAADRKGRSTNAEIVATLEDAYPDPHALLDELSFIDEIDEIQAKLERIRALRLAEAIERGKLIKEDIERIIDEADGTVGKPKK
ncbi:Arc family DNA-binding protein [Ensifer aridi]|uniref:Arc family DNA-binding protein n=1 Tax=Ensifer aridi TaxID=1708715 RepID=UPI000A0FA78D|nr:Arc family DNA-binding protein [Ensifer aridi]